jgi:hypothetical protein
MEGFGGGEDEDNLIAKEERQYPDKPKPLSHLSTKGITATLWNPANDSQKNNTKGHSTRVCGKENLFIVVNRGLLFPITAKRKNYSYPERLRSPEFVHISRQL